MGMFLSTFLMRVDKKGRVSVPASFRAALSEESNGIIAFRTLGFDAIDARGRAEFESLLATLRSHSVANLGPELAILGGAAPSPDQIVAATAAEIPFDGEGFVPQEPESVREARRHMGRCRAGPASPCRRGPPRRLAPPRAAG